MKLIDRFGQFEIYIISIFILTPPFFPLLKRSQSMSALSGLKSSAGGRRRDFFFSSQCISNLCTRYSILDVPNNILEIAKKKIVLGKANPNNI